MPELDDRSGSVAPETTKLILSKATVGRKCYLPDLADFKGPDLLVMNATLRDWEIVAKAGDTINGGPAFDLPASETIRIVPLADRWVALSAVDTELRSEVVDIADSGDLVALQLAEIKWHLQVLSGEDLTETKPPAQTLSEIVEVLRGMTGESFDDC